jgi:CheY-like chemotaxis protein
MSKILLVDVDPATLNTFSEALKTQSTDIQILTAGDAREVSNIITGEKVNMIIIDLKMPDNDDLQTLANISYNFPNIPVIVMTAFGTPEIELKIKALYTCQYYEKPVDMNALAEKIFEDLGVGVGGQIHGIALSSFLQMSEMEKTTCRLKIKSEEGEGSLYLQKGELIAAETGLLNSEEAAFEIISWDNAVIEIEKSGHKKKREIKMPLMNILMEGLKIKDERDAAEKEKQARKAETTLERKQGVKKTDVAGRADGEEGVSGRPVASPEDAAEKKTGLGDWKRADRGAKKPKRKRLVSVFLWFFLSIAIAGGGGVLWIEVIQPRLLENEFRKVLAEVETMPSLEEKESLLQEYIDSHDQSRHTIEANRKIKEIFHLIQERDYENAVNQVADLPIDKDFKEKATGIYKGYRDRFSNGIRVNDIKKKMEEIPLLVDENDYQELKRIDPHDYEKRISAYQAYLNEHKEGKYRDEVQELISDISEIYYEYVKKEIAVCNREQDWGRCIQLCDKYVASYKKGRQLPEIRNLRDRMNTAMVMNSLRQNAAEKDGDHQAVRKIYQDYLTANSDTSAQNEIHRELTLINKKIREKEAWEDIAKISKNKQIDLFERIRKLEKYMSRKPEAIYLKGAGVLMNRLEKEKEELSRLRQIAEEQKRLELERIAAAKKEKERLQNEKLKIGSVLSRSSDRFIVNVDGTVSDRQTGLMWCILDSHIELQECLDHDAAEKYVKNLEVGGYKDWRLPTANDLMVVMNTRNSFPKSGAKWYWTSELFWKGFYEFGYTVVNRSGDTWAKDEAEMTQCGAVRAVRQ